MNQTKEILAYLQKLPIQEQTILRNLRDQILSISPNLEEKLSRGVPFFYYLGKRAVGFRSSKNHLSFFIMEGNVFKNKIKTLSGFDWSSTVIRFKVEKPLPKSLVEELVLARLKEIEQTKKREE